MILGRAICKILDEVSIEVSGKKIGVKTNLGNKDALDKFIAESDAKKATKYPLIFYVTGTVYREQSGHKYCRTKLIIMMNTSENLLYKERTDKVYTPYIEPIYQEVKKVLSNNPYIQVLADIQGEKFPYDDEANFGIVKGKQKKSEESVVTDYVDARIINIDFKIKHNCIK